jgi:hypothetical protein
MSTDLEGWHHYLGEDEETYECPFCGGAGFIEIETESDLGQLRASTRDCPECTVET